MKKSKSPVKTSKAKVTSQKSWMTPKVSSPEKETKRGKEERTTKHEATYSTAEDKESR